ncbi:MAG: hypothetical protein Ta2D_11040 [Rickettsiales bacterium]|nr:MAG: hypothetical protein Ta2D_11040 [Rickettsiales bacterium]
MSDGLVSIIVALIGVFGVLIGYYITRKMELEKIDKQLDKETEIREKEGRREFLALTIKDETQSAGVRRAAAREYLEKGYNGVIKQFIYENALDK